MASMVYKLTWKYLSIDQFEILKELIEKQVPNYLFAKRASVQIYTELNS